MLSLRRMFAITAVVAMMIAWPAIARAFPRVVDIPSFVHVTLGTFTFIVIGCETVHWTAAWSIVFGGYRSASQTQLRRARHWVFLATLGISFASLSGFLLGLMIYLGDFSDPWTIPSGVAIAMIPIFYGLIGLSVLIPALCLINEKLSDSSGGNDMEPPQK